MLFGAVVFHQCFLRTRFRVVACIPVIPSEAALSGCLKPLYLIDVSEGTLMPVLCRSPFEAVLSGCLKPLYFTDASEDSPSSYECLYSSDPF